MSAPALPLADDELGDSFERHVLTLDWSEWMTAAELRSVIYEDPSASTRALVLAELAVAHEFGRGCSTRQLRSGVSRRSADIDAARDELIRDGLVERRAGRNGGFEFWLFDVFERWFASASA